MTSNLQNIKALCFIELSECARCARVIIGRVGNLILNTYITVKVRFLIGLIAGRAHRAQIADFSAPVAQPGTPPPGNVAGRGVTRNAAEGNEGGT